jgi:hypothetical protein
MNNLEFFSNRTSILKKLKFKTKISGYSILICFFIMIISSQYNWALTYSFMLGMFLSFSTFLKFNDKVNNFLVETNNNTYYILKFKVFEFVLMSLYFLS